MTGKFIGGSLLILAGGVLISSPHAYFLSSPSPQSFFSMLVADRGVAVQRNLRYGPHARHRLDVYRPKDGDGKGPVVVFLYGGGWRAGRRSTYGFVGAALAARGITTIIPDYRLFPKVKFPAFVNDAARAYAWTFEHIAKKSATKRPIFLVGHSAGAHIAALLAFDARYLNTADPMAARPAGFIGLAGPYAFDPTTWPTTKEIFSSVSDADNARPISFVSAAAPPVLVMHGLADKTVRLFNTRDLAAALSGAGVTVRKLEFPRIGHIGLLTAIARPLRWRAPVLEETVKFIDKVAKGLRAGPNKK